MKDNKKTKTNANYFTKTETLKTAGIIILIASGVEFFLGRTYIGYIISCIGLAVGLAATSIILGVRLRSDLRLPIRERKF